MHLRHLLCAWNVLQIFSDMHHPKKERMSLTLRKPSKFDLVTNWNADPHLLINADADLSGLMQTVIGLRIHITTQ